MAIHRLFVAILLVVTVFVAPAGSSVMAAEIQGHWRTENGGQVQIRPCGSTLCGYITEVSVPRHIYKKYKDLIEEVGMQNLPDVFNEKPELRNRPLLGLRIFTVTGNEPEGRLKGQLYNAEDGKTYEGVLTVRSNDSIELAGCVFFNLVCRSEVWKRVH